MNRPALSRRAFLAGGGVTLAGLALLNSPWAAHAFALPPVINSMSTLPAWLEGLWDRDDVYVMTEDQAGDANDGLTTTDSWPNILRYPFLTRASATYPSPNGTKAFPNGVKVIVFLPGDYSMRKMHAGRPTEWWPHWDMAVGPNAPTAGNPFIVVYADAYMSYSDMHTHPKLRSESQQADLAFLKFDKMVGVYLHGLRSIAPISGVDYAGTTDGKIYGCWIETDLSSGVIGRFGAHRNIVSDNFLKRRYPWVSDNDFPGLYLKDGPNEDNIFEHNVVLNYADSFQGSMRSHLYRQDPLGINITAGGSGYIVGDPLVFGVGTTTAVYRHAVGTVSAVDPGGTITAVATTDQGAYQGGFPSVTVTSGAGAGATFTCTALAGSVIIFGDNFLAPDIWEQGWTENTGYGGIAGTILRYNWFGCTDEVKVGNVYNTIRGIENCVDLKTGGTAQKPVLVHNNYMFGLRANGGSPSGCFTFHDVCSDVNIYDNTICDMSSVFNLNTQYYRDRAPNDGGSTGGTAYQVWEGFTTIDFHDNAINDIHNFATTASFLAMQGRIFYSGNSLTYRNNWHSYCDYLAAEVVNPQAPPFVFAGNGLPSTTDLGPYMGSLPAGWTVYTPGVNTATVLTIPYTSDTITVNRTQPTTMPTNARPLIAVTNASVTVAEGQTAANSGTVSDADGHTVSLSASVGTVVNNSNGTWSWGFNTSDGSLQSQTVTIIANDGHGGTSQTTFGLTVNNVAPTVGAISAPVNPQPVGTTINTSASFNDPGTGDTHTAIWDWEGATSAGTVNETNGAGTVSGSHSYPTPGVYTIKVTVTDDDGGNGQSLFQYVVIYDPNSGFVTGGGWLLSPAGAYVANPALTGRANFGFNAKYKKGQSMPDGNTEFQFQTGTLNFQSTSYEWLVVAGANAKFKGIGTINGSGNYGFMLTAVDGQISGGGGVDKFRIKIWDKNHGDAVIYDNQLGQSDDAAGTVLGGGSIVIHSSSNGNNANAATADDDANAQPNRIFLPLVER